MYWSLQNSRARDTRSLTFRSRTKLSKVMKVIYTIRYWFLFSKPVFTYFDYSDLIIDNNKLLVLSWKLANGHKVWIRKFSKKYYSKEQSVIVTLPYNSIYVDIVASNYWRSSAKRIYLKFIPLENQSAAMLIVPFKVLHKTAYLVILEDETSWLQIKVLNGETTEEKLVLKAN